MKTTLFILILSAAMAYLTGCAINDSEKYNRSGNGDPVSKCKRPAAQDLRGGCSARWV